MERFHLPCYEPNRTNEHSTTDQEEYLHCWTDLGNKFAQIMSDETWTWKLCGMDPSFSFTIQSQSGGSSFLQVPTVLVMRVVDLFG